MLPNDTAGLVSDTTNKTILEQILAVLSAQAASQGITDFSNPNAFRQLDNQKREVVTMGAQRGFLYSQTTTISASTAETTIVNGDPNGASLDIYAILVTNTSASTVCRVDIRDSTGGVIRAQIQSVGGTPTNGFSLGGWLLPQINPGGNWTATCGTSTTDIRITVLYTRNT